MSDLKVCRICLNKNVRLYKLEQFNLKHYYEQITQSTVVYKDDLPRYFCFECAALLHKYHKFKEKCDYGQITLKNLVFNGFLSLYVIEDIRKNRTDLYSSLDYINYKCDKNIKTYNVKYKEPHEIENIILNSFPEDDVIKYELIPDDNLMKYEDVPMTENINAKINTVDIAFTKRNPVSSESSMISTETTIFAKTDETPKNNEHLQNNITNTSNTAHKIPNIISSDVDDSDYDMDIDLDTVKVSLENEVIEIERIVPSIKSNDSKSKAKGKKTTRGKTEGVKSKKCVSNKAKSKNSVADTQQDTDKPTQYRFENKPKKGQLSKEHWDIKVMKDEEALENFKKKEFDDKYIRSTFKCTKCFKGFSKIDMLLRHNKMWHEKNQVECRFCHMQFKWKNKMVRHMQQHYYIYKCLRCELQFYLKHAAMFHEDHHNGVIHKCKICGEEYTHISTYYTHLRTSHRNAHACKLCGATFISDSGLLFHMKRKHCMHDNSEESSTNIYCQKCDVSFVSQNAFDEHLIKSKLHEEENKEFKHIKRKRREILANAARCIHCNKKFRSKTECKTHIDLEHPGKNKVERVVCEVCGACLAASYIDIHMNRHTRKHVYPCQICGKEFLCSTTRSTHQLTHTGEKPFPCPACPKRFGLKGHMEVHYKRIHLKEPYPKSGPNVCPICNKPFESRWNMDTHYRRVHLKDPFPKSGPKPCPICAKPFASRANMDTHYRRVHLKEPYPKRTYNRKKNRQPDEVPLYEAFRK